MAEEVKCLPQAIEKYVPDYEAIRQRVLSVFVEKVFVPRNIRRQGRERARVFRYMLKCERVFQVIASELGRVARLPRTSSMHPFYAELVNLASEGKYDEVLERAAKAVKIVSKLWKEYREKILACYTGLQAKQLAREFVGRALSAAKRGLRGVEYVKNAVKMLSQTPCIDVDEPLIVVAGMPQVGKSTLVGRISSAKPKVAPYPFTTKHVILGHFEWGRRRFQIMDTPGILDRPVEEMNPIERKAVAAIKLLPSVTLFLIDPSPDAYFSLDKQLKVLQSVAQFVGKDRLMVVFNKIDKTPSDRLAKVEEMVKSLGFEVDAKISALHGIGIDDMLAKAIKKLEELESKLQSSTK